MVASGHGEPTVLKLIVITSRGFTIGADADDLWQAVQPGPLVKGRLMAHAAALPSNCWGNRLD